MHRRRLAVLLALSLLLWISSSITPFTYRNAMDSAFAGVLPTTTPRSQPRSVTSSGSVHLPLVANGQIPPAPPAPAMTTSRYVVTTNPTQMDTAGCNQGLAGEQGFVILDFGYPYYDSATADYGTKLLSAWDQYPFVGGLLIENLTWYFMRGWVRCAPPGATLEVAMGLANRPFPYEQPPQLPQPLTAEHARWWASYVADQAYLISINSNMAGRVSVAAAMDIEPSWNTWAATRIWYDAFDPGWFVPFYNFGSCDSCPYFDNPTWTPHDYGWELEDIYYVSTRSTSNGTVSLPFPEIYKIPPYMGTIGPNADQWYRLSLYGVTNHYGNYLNFKGALTTYYGCKDWDNWPTCVQLGIINTPEQGWTQLWRAVNADPRTAPGSPLFLSDIRWYVTNVK